MTMNRWWTLTFALVAIQCGGTHLPPTSNDRTPQKAPLPQRCSRSIENPKPFIVDWDSTDRGLLEAMTRRGVVAVHRDGCKVEIIDSCQVPHKYSYAPLTPKRDTVHIRDIDSLYASIPVGAVSLEGKLARSGELAIERALVGRFELARAPITRGELAPQTCKKATHIVTGLSVGAFRFLAGRSTEAGAAVGVLGAKAGGDTRSSLETLSVEGDLARCALASGSDTEPPFGCGGLIQVELTPIGGGANTCKARGAETCNGVDDDCNAVVDDGCPKDVALAPLPAAPLVGGSGGGDFARDCPSGQVVRGFYGTYGVYVYELGVMCGTVSLKTNESGEPFTIAIEEGATLPALGGNVLGEKTPWSFTCPPGSLVSALSGRSGEFVDQLTVRCSRLRVTGAPGSHRVVREPGSASPAIGGGGGNPFETSCGGSGVLSGVRGRAGAWLDAVGGSCAGVTLIDGGSSRPKAALTSAVEDVTVGSRFGCPDGQELVDGSCYATARLPAIEDFRRAWPDATTRRWSGMWSKTGWRFAFSLTLTRNRINLDGAFRWQLAEAPPGSPLQNRIGASGQEMVRGTVDIATGVISLAGYGVDDPSLLSPDHYELRLSPSGSLSGSTKTWEGTWGGVLVAKPL